MVAEVGSVEVARDPEVRALRAANKRLAQELDMLKKPWSSSASRPREYLSRHRPVPGAGAHVPALPRVARRAQRVLRLVQAEGHSVGRWRIRRVLNAHGLHAQQPRSFVPRTTDSDPAVCAAPNRLLG